MHGNAKDSIDISDDAPELTDDWFAEADLVEGAHVVRRGRPKSTAPKKLVSLRLDQDIVEKFRATGPGWQSRINETLRGHLPK